MKNGGKLQYLQIGGVKGNQKGHTRAVRVGGVIDAV